MRRGAFRSTLFWAAAFVLGCSSSGLSCGGCMEPIPGGFPADEREPNAITAKLTRDGLDFFESQVNTIISQIIGGLSFNVPCTQMSQDLPVLGRTDIYLCDHSGNRNCNQAGNPPLRDERRSIGLHACEAQASVTRLKIDPTQLNPHMPVDVKVQLDLRMNTGSIPIAIPVPLCGTVKCKVEFDSNASGSNEIPVRVPVTLKIDPMGNLLSYTLGDLDLGEVIESGDLYVASDGGSLCSFACDLGNIGFVKDLLVGLVKDMVDDQLAGMLDTMRCLACDANSPCPTGSVCDGGLCYRNKATHDCAPMQLGMEGRMAAGELLASFGGEPESMLDVYAVAGGYDSDGTPSVKAQSGGIVLGLLGGTRPVALGDAGELVAPGVATCVPPAEWYNRSAQTAIDFDDEALNGGPPVAGYQIGIAISDNFLDKALYSAQQSGLLCLNIDSSVTTFLSSGLFSTFLPSLGVLTGGRDVPMMIALRPHLPPEILIGKGTTREVNGAQVPDDPLLTVEMKETQLDFYAFVDERYVRLFTLLADINLPLSLDFGPEGDKLQPVLADLSTLVTNIRALNSEMLAEDPAIVASLLDAVVGLLEPMLAGALGPMDLPELQGFKLAVSAARGAVKYQWQPGYKHLALFTQLRLGQPLVNAVRTQVDLIEAFVPSAQQLLNEGKRPFAMLRARGESAKSVDFRGYEFSWRVDGGLWSPWVRQEQFEVRNSVLMLQGRHDIEVRSREIDQPFSVDRHPAVVSLVVDYDAPRAAFELDMASRQVRTRATDAVAHADELLYSYRVAGGSWTAPGAARVFELDDLGTNASLEVEVTDPSGHTGRAVFGIPADQLHDGPGPKAAERVSGCTQSGASLLAVVGVILALVLRRRRSA